MIRRITALAFALTLVPLAGAFADDVGGGEVIMIDKQKATMVAETPVTAPPPPFVELEQTAIAAGIGARFGGGTLLVGGQEHPFKMTGVSLGEVGFAKIEASGVVQNLENVEDFAGRYVALEAGAAAGVGVSAVTMRNDKGVVITLQTDVTGVQLALAASGLTVELD